MLLKRKRSEEGIHHIPMPFEYGYSGHPGSDDSDMSDAPSIIYATGHQPASIYSSFSSIAHQLGSRTRKRFRDDRPDEDILRENTIQRLFQAQRQPDGSPPPSVSSSSSTSSTARPISSSSSSNPSAQRKAQASLHNFWSLPCRPFAPQIKEEPVPDRAMMQTPRCEDCDSALAEDEDAMAGMTDLDGQGCSRCRMCGRSVCDMCAVVSVGEGRECLQCKTSRRTWVGGIGWA